LNIRNANTGNRLLGEPDRQLPEIWKFGKKEHRKVKRNNIQQAKVNSNMNQSKAESTKYKNLRWNSETMCALKNKDIKLKTKLHKQRIT